jgi:RNA polymerase sigma-70 factor, ECF subfamily
LTRKQDPSDIVQECQLYAARNFSQFQGKGPREFSAWLRGILDRRIKKAIRFWKAALRRQSREQPLPVVGSAQYELSENCESPLSNLCNAEDRERLVLVLGWCREEDRELIMLRHFDGRSHEQIAAQLGVEVEVARQRYCRAMSTARDAAKLLALLDERGIDGRRQEVIVLYRIQRLTLKQIVDSLGLTRQLVTDWIEEANPLFEDVKKVEK